MTHRDSDLKMLKEILEHSDDLNGNEVEAFADMQFDLTAYENKDRFHELTEKQREWVKRVHERVVPAYSNLVSGGLAPRGREVPTPPALQNLPKKPPPMPRHASPSRMPGMRRRHCGRTDEGCYALINGDCACECCR